MAKAKKFELEDPAPILNDKDEETLAAIDEGIRDAEAGRTVPAEEVRQRFAKGCQFSLDLGLAGDFAAGGVPGRLP
jgi:hypothetical protein